MKSRVICILACGDYNPLTESDTPGLESARQADRIRVFEMKALLFNALRVFSLLAAGVVGFAQAPSSQIAHQNAPFFQIARELQNRKVVALADFAHQNAFPFHTVTLVLSNWHSFSLQSTNGGKLVLALEADDLMAEVLNRYLKTGDLEAVLDFWLPFNSMDLLEFYDNLRKFNLRLEESNRVLTADQRLSFRAVGLEPPSPLSATNVNAEALPAPWQAGAVANERDRHLANKLMAHLTQYPKEQVLVFYGDSHLVTRSTSPSWAAKLFGATEVWEPLGFHLKRELGTNFLSIAQVQFPRAIRRPDNSHYELTKRDILVNAIDIPWKLDRFEATGYDAIVFLSAAAVDEAHLLKYVCSRRVLDRAVDRLAWLEQLPHNTFTARHPVYSSTMGGLQLLTGRSFEASEQWRTWMATNSYDGFARMDSADFSEAIRVQCGQRGKGTQLASLGLPMALAFRNQPVSREQWQDLWPKVQPTVRFLQCLGIYWVGYPEEAATARKYLVKFSGQDFECPADYLRWLRKNRMGLTY